jgi:hypothetical protein
MDARGYNIICPKFFRAYKKYLRVKYSEVNRKLIYTLQMVLAIQGNNQKKRSNYTEIILMASVKQQNKVTCSFNVIIIKIYRFHDNIFSLQLPKKYMYKPNLLVMLLYYFFLSIFSFFVFSFVLSLINFFRSYSISNVTPSH